MGPVRTGGAVEGRFCSAGGKMCLVLPVCGFSICRSSSLMATSLVLLSAVVIGAPRASSSSLTLITARSHGSRPRSASRAASVAPAVSSERTQAAPSQSRSPPMALMVSSSTSSTGVSLGCLAAGRGVRSVQASAPVAPVLHVTLIAILAKRYGVRGRVRKIISLQSTPRADMGIRVCICNRATTYKLHIWSYYYHDAMMPRCNP
jgi:hypothetical protein